MNQNRKPFGTLPDGTAAELITLKNETISCSILTYGATLQSLVVPDACGNPIDVVLGFDSLEDYRTQPGHLGALIGRYANRIANARFTMDGKEYPLFANDGPNHLHGGAVGFDKQLWTVEDLTEDTLVLSLTSPDGQEGYPGTLKVQVTYRLVQDSLELDYYAVSDKDTLCNLTNHAYFNLGGHESGLFYDQLIQIHASRYLPALPGCIPTGEIADVSGTPMDLREPTGLQTVLDEFPQLRLADGFDHTWVLDNWDGSLRPAANVHSPKTGITMSVETTKPGVQFYSGNFLDDVKAGKSCPPYEKYHAICLETQYFPDSPNHPEFPSPWLKAGEEYRHKTIYRFSRLDLSSRRFDRQAYAGALKGKKINFLGDSITQGIGATHPRNAYVSLIEAVSGALCRNYGIGGTRIAAQSKPSEWPLHDLDFCMRAKEMEPDADYVVVFGGTNDYGHGDAPFGDFSDRTPDTFCGALHTLYTTLITRYPYAKILVITPLHRVGETNPKANEPRILKDYVDMIRQTAEYYSLPVLDLFATSGLQPNIPIIQQSFFPDGLHPNNAGYEVLADKIIRAICAL